MRERVAPLKVVWTLRLTTSLTHPNWLSFNCLSMNSWGDWITNYLNVSNISLHSSLAFRKVLVGKKMIHFVPVIFLNKFWVIVKVLWSNSWLILRFSYCSLPSTAAAPPGMSLVMNMLGSSPICGLSVPPAILKPRPAPPCKMRTLSWKTLLKQAMLIW